MIRQNIGSIQMALGDRALAAESFDRSLSLYQKIGNGRRSAEVSRLLGNLHFESGAGNKAIENLNSALTFYREKSEPLNISAILKEIGLIYLAAKDRRAVGSFEEAVPLEALRTGESGMAQSTAYLMWARNAFGDPKTAVFFGKLTASLLSNGGVSGRVSSTGPDASSFENSFRKLSEILKVEGRNAEAEEISKWWTAFVDAASRNDPSTTLDELPSITFTSSESALAAEYGEHYRRMAELGSQATTVTDREIEKGSSAEINRAAGEFRQFLGSIPARLD